MGLSKLVDSDGNVLMDADGNILYVFIPTPDPNRVVVVTPENRKVVVRSENRKVVVSP